MSVSILPPDQPFSLSAGRPIYTGNASSTLRYTDPLTATEKTLSLERFKRYIFSDALSGSVVSGKLYVLSPSGSEKLAYIDDMRGMPLLPESRILHPEGEVIIYSPQVGTSLTLSRNTEYRHISLGKIASSYSSNFSFPNGFYSAKLRSLTDDRNIRA